MEFDNIRSAVISNFMRTDTAKLIDTLFLQLLFANASKIAFLVDIYKGAYL
jgi:hypothetical protein